MLERLGQQLDTVVHQSHVNSQRTWHYSRVRAISVRVPSVEAIKLSKTKTTTRNKTKLSENVWQYWLLNCVSKIGININVFRFCGSDPMKVNDFDFNGREWSRVKTHICVHVWACKDEDNMDSLLLVFIENFTIYLRVLQYNGLLFLYWSFFFFHG